MPSPSTGYYFISNNAEIKNGIEVSMESFKDTTDNSISWKRIYSGPRQANPDYWTSPDNKFGQYYFRNPANDDPNTPEVEYFQHNFIVDIDSTDNAFAGPISLDLNGGFNFNGMTYDSFYVSTNGLIALSNRRYNYNSQGNRITINGSIYSQNSQDWFVRGRTNPGVYDDTADDYGYKYIAMGNDHQKFNGGIRAKGNKRLSGNTFGDIKNIRSPIIAPLWGDMELSQFAKRLNKIDDHGKVYFGVSNDKTKLYIYFVNLQLIGDIQTVRGGDFSLSRGNRPNDENYISANVQVILDSKTNDIFFIYEKFNGVVNQYFTSKNNSIKLLSSEIFRENTTSGVRGFARHNNYNRKDREFLDLKGNKNLYKEGDLYEYEQATHQWLGDTLRKNNYLQSNRVVKFNQFKNTVRAVDIQYNVRDKVIDDDDELAFNTTIKSSQTVKYELLAGVERLDAIQPIAIFQNMSNDIQGVNGINYEKQDFKFKTKFTITNKASGRVVYNKTIQIDSSCLAVQHHNLENCIGEFSSNVRLANLFKVGDDYQYNTYENQDEFPDKQYHFPGDGTYSTKGKPFNGIPPYGYVFVQFPPFIANEKDKNHIGNLEAKAIAISETPNGEPILQDWTFDDTLSRNLFVMKRLNHFYDNVTEFNLIDGKAMPSVWKWVSKGAEVVSGDEVSKHPLPPQGEYLATYIDEESDSLNAWIPEKIAAAKNFKLNSPVIKMNRVDLEGNEPKTNPGGDVITSYPINLKQKKGNYLAISIQRTEHRENWDRGWSDAKLIGPEPRVMHNSNIFNQYSHPNDSCEFPDEIVVEYLNQKADNLPERLIHITNPDESRWRMHPRRGGLEPETNVPAFGLFGAGGYRMGFLESDPDSSLALENNPNINSLRANPFDDGIDDVYKRFYISIPEAFLNQKYNTSDYFRFRVRVLAGDDGLLAKQGIKGTIPDDDDDFFIDNIEILEQDLEATDIEINHIRIGILPTGRNVLQLTRVPISVGLYNNTAIGAPTYFVRVRIYKKGLNYSIYDRVQAIPAHFGKSYIPINIPSFNIRWLGIGEFRFLANIMLPGDYDKNTLNDTVNFKFTIDTLKGELLISDQIAYDPINNHSNDVPILMNYTNYGLNLFGRNNGSDGDDFIWDRTRNEAGDNFGTGSGQIASKFHLLNQDTVRGIRCYFSSFGATPDDISLAIYDDANGIPGREIRDSRIYRQKGLSDVLFDENGNKLIVFDDYVEYRLDKPLILQPGNYWTVVTQLGQNGLNLGASSYRGGMRILHVYDMPDEPKGLGNIQLALNKQYRRPNIRGTQLLNNNYFAVENSPGSNEWLQFMPNTGNPAYPHNNYLGLSPVDKKTFTMSRGFWIPMLRPVLNFNIFNNRPIEETIDPPVELSEFSGIIRNRKAELFWVTESEIDNKGFYLERKLDQENETKWQRITWINGNGKGNFTLKTKYSFTDESIALNKVYNYRIHQEDIDGTYDNTSSGIVTLKAVSDSEVSLIITSENPFSDYLTYTVTHSEKSNLSITILDVLGNLVYSNEYQNLDQGTYNFDWDISKSQIPLSNGTYLLIVKSNDKQTSQKLTLIR